MRYYDKGFITNYTDSVKLEVFNAGVSVISLRIYEDRVCKSTFVCQDLKTFNKENLSKKYENDFLYKLLQKDDKVISFKDKEENIIIKVIKE